MNKQELENGGVSISIDHQYADRRPSIAFTFKHLIEPFCEHPLVRYDHEVGSNKDTEYQERCLTIITWFESTVSKSSKQQQSGQTSYGKCFNN